MKKETTRPKRSMPPDSRVSPRELRSRRAAFKSMHTEGCFVIPNPWDRGSALYLHQLGFLALATTSAGAAFSRGLPDTPNALPLRDVLVHIRELVTVTELPVNADFQSGYAKDAEGVHENVAACIATGVAGLSIEDATGEPLRPLFEIERAVDRVRAARAAIDESGAEVMLTARAECHLVGHPDPLAESVRRLQAYAAAGADVLYAPGLKDAVAIRRVVESVAPKPVNVLVGSASKMTVSELAQLGVRRVSVGSALARVAWTAFMRAARNIAGSGSFSDFEGIATVTELSGMFDPND